MNNIICQICKMEFKRLSYSHLKIHNINFMEYKILFPNIETTSIEIRQKISENHINVSGKNNPNYGKHHTKETKEKISKAIKGKKNLQHSIWMKNNNPSRILEVKIKQSESLKGRIFSEEHKKKLSENNGMKRPEVRIKFLGKNHPNWNNGSSFLPYCYKFNRRLKEQVRERDNYQCQNPSCLTTQLESQVLYYQKLHIHHIHYDKENCYPDLITLCVSCNIRANYNRDYWEDLFIEILKKRNLLNCFGDIK